MAEERNKSGKSDSLWRRLFPGSPDADRAANLNVQVPPVASYDDFVFDALRRDQVEATGEAATSEESARLIYDLPITRLQRYPIYRAMADDPTIDSALKMHITHALSARTDTGEIVSIESTSDETDPIVIDLRNTFKDTINQNCQMWAYNAALLGICFARVYGRPGKGVELIRSDYYTHPQFIKMYEHAGQIAGYTAAHQNIGKNRGYIALMEPWKFVHFRIPIWRVNVFQEPARTDGTIFDLGNDDWGADAVVESLNYGQSIIETAFGPWMDLHEAIVSLNMSRKNASRLERMVGVNTGKLSPQRAAQYLNIVSQQMLKVNEANAKASIRRGFVQTVINHLIPIFGDGRGRLDISTVEGSPNIEGLADVDFHIKRLGSALGVDPALLGFGEMLSGGLGDGGFFRISVIAAIKANMLRRAIATGLEQLFEIHVAYKHGKVYLPGEKPWRIIFNSISSALAREEQENNDGRAAFAISLAQLVSLMDPEFTGTDRNAMANYLWTDILRVDEEKFKKMFPKKMEPPPVPEGEGDIEEEEQIVEAARKIVNKYAGRRK